MIVKVCKGVNIAMTRQNYGSLRGGGTTRRGGAWQWTVIGFVFGFGCAAIVGLI